MVIKLPGHRCPLFAAAVDSVHAAGNQACGAVRGYSYGRVECFGGRFRDHISEWCHADQQSTRRVDAATLGILVLHENCRLTHARSKGVKGEIDASHEAISFWGRDVNIPAADADFHANGPPRIGLQTLQSVSKVIYGLTSPSANRYLSS